MSPNRKEHPLHSHENPTTEISHVYERTIIRVQYSDGCWVVFRQGPGPLQVESSNVRWGDVDLDAARRVANEAYAAWRRG
jgi:hypothetical protein